MAALIEKEKTGSTPYVLVDAERGYFTFEGESFHENVVEFFRDVTDWLNGYLASDFKELTFDCRMVYFNSSTAKLLMNILLGMDERAADGGKVTVNWIVSGANDIMMECGEDFREEMNNLEFNVIVTE